jgi:hypothetical protein
MGRFKLQNDEWILFHAKRYYTDFLPSKDYPTFSIIKESEHDLRVTDGSQHKTVAEVVKHIENLNQPKCIDSIFTKQFGIIIIFF